MSKTWENEDYVAPAEFVAPEEEQVDKDELGTLNKTITTGRESSGVWGRS